MPGLQLGTFGGVANRPQPTTAPNQATSVTQAAFGPGYTMSGPSTGAALMPNDPGGIIFWTGVGGIAGLAYLRHTLPSNMKKTFDLVLMFSLLWAPAKGLAKGVIARHSAQDKGIAQDLSQAASIIL
jgi:hypothetical protein